MKNKFGYTILGSILVICSSVSLVAQDSSSIHTLLKKIQDRQVSHDLFFMQGIFPSYVSDKKVYKEKRKDNNIFYTVIISYTLKTLRPKLSAADQLIVDSIIARSEKLAVQFKNRNGKESYNFWRTDSAYRLPYLWWARVRKKNILPDDFDCTSMCLLIADAPASTTQKAHALMQQYVNKIYDPTNTIFLRYRPYAAYSAWMENRFPVVFDICVLTNVLSFVQTYGLSWTKADSASLDLVIATLHNKDHIINPSIVSPYYNNSAIILYHLARLMSIKPIPALESMRGSLIGDALKQLEQTDNEFEKLILNNALLKWDYHASIPGIIRMDDISKNDLPFFVGNIPSIFHLGLKKPLSKKEIVFYYHYCPAYNDVLLLEYLVLKNENTNGFAAKKKQ